MKDLQNKLLFAALEGSRFGICVVDGSGRVLLVNHVFAQKLGLAREDLLGQSYRVLTQCLGHSPHFHSLFECHSADVSSEILCTFADHLQRYMLFRAASLDADMNETFRVISAFDVTDYGQTRDHFVLLQRQIEALQQSVVIVDAKKADMPIAYVNQHFARMTGYSFAETVGRNCRFLQGHDTQQAGVQQLRLAILQRESCRVQLTNYRKDGAMFINDLFVSPVFDEAGELTHYIGVQRELSPAQAVPTS
jgi:PAS domain S-box-containing protein